MIDQPRPPALQTKEADLQGKHYLRLLGRLDAQSVPQLLSDINAMLRDGIQEINLDLSELESIDASGVSAFITIHETLRARQAQFLIQWAPPAIYNILKSSQLDRNVDILPDRRKAPRRPIRLERNDFLGNLSPCHELFGCEFTECVYFNKEQYVCWTLPHAPCKSVISDDLLEEIASCTKCVVFQNNVQHLGEIYSHYSQYIREAENAFQQLRQRTESLEEAIQSRTRELMQSEARYRDLYEEANETLFDLEGPKGVFVAMNVEFERQTGLARQAWIGRSFLDLVSARDRARAAQEYRHALEGLKSAFELRLNLGEGRERVVLCNLRQTTPSGPIARIRGSWSDISELAKARDLSSRDMAALLSNEHESEKFRQQFEALFHSILDGVMLVDEQSNVSLFNKQFGDILGMEVRDLKDIPAKLFYDIISDRSEDPREFRKWMQAIAKESEETKHREIVLLRPERRNIRIYTAPVRNSDKTIMGRVWMLRDVTDQRMLEEQFVQSQKMESIGTMAGGIAHDFNNLLTSILGYSSILLRTVPPNHPHYRPLRNIDASAQRAAELTQGLLAFSRRRETKMRPIRLNDVVRDAVRLLGRMIPKQIEIITDLSANLPSVKGDAIQLEQVIMNLCVNARDSMKDGGRLTIRTALEDLKHKPLPAGVEPHQGPFVVLSVEDTGCGISEADRERIFEPFYTTKESGEGTGLGLSLAYAIIRSHGGFIDVHSALGRGSRFNLCFPPDFAEQHEIPRKTTADSTPQSGHGECILLVDDEPVVREVAESVLTQLGYRVLTAEGGHEAIALYQRQGAEVDLVLLDLMMPRMRGEKVFERLREMNPNLRIVISTGNPEMIDRFPDLKQHATGFADKPYRMGDLSKALSTALKC